MTLHLVHTDPLPIADPLAAASHRTANHFAMLAGMIRLEGRSLRKAGKALTADEVWLVLEESGRRLEIVGKVHQLLASNPTGSSIHAPDFLRTIVNAAAASSGANERIRIACEFPVAWFLGPDDAVALGLLVGELVTNAVKYSHPAGVCGAIKIEASACKADEIVIQISDDGVGLPEGIDPLESDTLGFRMMRALATQLGAKMSFCDYGLGLSCVVQMPVARRS